MSLRFDAVGLLIPLRQKWDLFINLRPGYPVPGIKTPLVRLSVPHPALIVFLLLLLGQRTVGRSGMH